MQTCLSNQLVTCKLQVPGLRLLGSGHQPCCVQLLPHTLLPMTQMDIAYKHMETSSTTMAGGHVAQSMHASGLVRMELNHMQMAHIHHTRQVASTSHLVTDTLTQSLTGTLTHSLHLSLNFISHSLIHATTYQSHTQILLNTADPWDVSTNFMHAVKWFDLPEELCLMPALARQSLLCAQWSHIQQ